MGHVAKHLKKKVVKKALKKHVKHIAKKHAGHKHTAKKHAGHKHALKKNVMHKMNSHFKKVDHAVAKVSAAANAALKVARKAIDPVIDNSAKITSHNKHKELLETLKWEAR